MILLGLCLIGLLGCGSSTVLVAAKDPTFDQAQVRLARTAQKVETLKPSVAEKTLFLQAEGFYQYRFEPPEQGNALILAEVAAAITDFPAFQSLAGSLSLQDMRYRSSDSAVQLWESLLARYPETPLKPLTLYRLGWAYRKVGTLGLPRQSPDEAFDELIKGYPDSPLASLALEARGVPWKSKEVATSRTLIPGMGQLYLGKTKSGLTRLAIALVSLVGILQPIRVAAQRKGRLSWTHDRPVLLTGFLGLVTLSFDYTSSYEDTMKGVVDYNETQENLFYQQHPTAP